MAISGYYVRKACKQSGIDVLIWDWYWYDGKPCLHEALENGFLEASNTKDASNGVRGCWCPSNQGRALLIRLYSVHPCEYNLLCNLKK